MQHRAKAGWPKTSRLGTALEVLIILGGISQTARAQMSAHLRTWRTAAVPPMSTPSSAEAGPQQPIPAAQSPYPAHETADFPAPPAAEATASLETLEQAWRTALGVDRQLAARGWEVSSAEHLLQAARAERWPTLSLESSYVVRSDEPAFRFGFPGVPLPTDVFPYAQDENFTFRTKVDLPLYSGGRISHGIAAAAAEVTSRQLQVRGSTNDLKLRVAEEYVAVLRAQREVEVTESNVRSLEAHARDVELLFRHEQVPQNDLLAAQVALSNARQRAIRAANQLDASRAAYNRHLGRPLTSEVRIAELPLEADQRDVDGLTAQALCQRPEIARLAAQVRALRDQATSLRAGNLPQFGLWGQYAFEENRFRTPEGLASVGVGLTYNVYDGGRTRHQAAARSRQAEALMRLRADLESVIALEVRQAWLDIRETHRRLEVTSAAVQRAEENLRVARKRYLAGMGISTEVLDAEALRTETYRNHHHATYDAVLAVLRLRHATGELAP